MRCPNCGNEIADGSNFCTMCGSKITTDSKESSTESEKKHSREAKEPFVWKDRHTYILIAVMILAAACIGFAVRISKTSDSDKDMQVSYEEPDPAEENSVDEDSAEEDLITDDSDEYDLPVTEGGYGDSTDDESENDFPEEDSPEGDAADINVADTVLDIREEYNFSVEQMNSGAYERKCAENGEIIYSDDGEIRVITVPEKSSGSEYAKSFYYYNYGDLYFAYYEADDANRFYFKDGTLIRWRYSANASKAQDAQNYDLENSEGYLNWCRLVLQDSAHYYQIGEDVEDEDTDYILPGSDSRYLDKGDLKGLSADECRLARNEIYARHGRLFDDEELQAYFDSKEWYNGTIKPSDFREEMLNDYEIYNRDLIVRYEEKKGYR